jgi:hypothetical protein
MFSNFPFQRICESCLRHTQSSCTDHGKCVCVLLPLNIRVICVDQSSRPSDLKTWGVYTSHIHWVPCGTGTPKDRDEIKRREVWSCEGWVCDEEALGASWILKAIRSAAACWFPRGVVFVYETHRWGHRGRSRSPVPVDLVTTNETTPDRGFWGGPTNETTPDRGFWGGPTNETTPDRVFFGGVAWPDRTGQPYRLWRPVSHFKKNWEIPIFFPILAYPSGPH